MTNRVGIQIVTALAALALFASVSEAAPSAFIRPQSILVRTAAVTKLKRVAPCQPGMSCDPDEIDFTRSYWLPGLSFRVQGPIAAGTVLSAEFTNPQGTKFFTMPAVVVDHDVAAVDHFDYDATGGVDNRDQGQGSPGHYGMTITAKRGSAASVLYLGSFDVKAVRSRPTDDAPASKDLLDFYVDYDWALATAWLDTWHIDGDATGKNPPHPLLESFVWFRDDGRDQYNITSTLLYNGKKIDDWTGSATATIGIGPTSMASKNFAWCQYQMLFRKVLATATAGSPATFFIDKNPGDYEIRVMRNGALDRSIKFTVGADGKLPDVYHVIGVTYDRYLVAAQVFTEGEGTVDTTAWQRGMFFGPPTAVAAPAAAKP